VFSPRTFFIFSSMLYFHLSTTVQKFLLTIHRFHHNHLIPFSPHIFISQLFVFCFLFYLLCIFFSIFHLFLLILYSMHLLLCFLIFLCFARSSNLWCILLTMRTCSCWGTQTCTLVYYVTEPHGSEMVSTLIWNILPCSCLQRAPVNGRNRIKD
jgi:hypothetical protein